MKSRMKIGALATVGATALVCAIIASPAQALGTKQYACSGINNDAVTGQTTSTQGLTTQTNSGGCGQVKLKVGYYAPGGVSTYTGWTYGSKTVTRSSASLGTIFGGYHGVTDPAPLNDKAGQFNT